MRLVLINFCLRGTVIDLLALNCLLIALLVLFLAFLMLDLVVRQLPSLADLLKDLLPFCLLCRNCFFHHLNLMLSKRNRLRLFWSDISWMGDLATRKVSQQSCTRNTRNCSWTLFLLSFLV